MDCEARTHNILEHMLLDKNAEPKILPISLLKEMTKDFSSDLEIGKGGFAVVYKGLLGNGRTVAVKKLKSNTILMDEDKYIQEVVCLMRVKHKNVVRFLGYCADTQGEVLAYEGKPIMAELVRQRLLCFEYLPNGSLDQFITDVPGALEWRKRYKIIKGICEGLHYLHENNILHLDLKPGNILLDDNMVPKISDFGISRCFDEKQSRAITANLHGSLGYMAPELLNSKVITKKCDIYSLGVLILEILTGQRGYMAPDQVENVLEFWRNRFETSWSDKGMLLEQVRVCVDIGMKCGDFDPAKRPEDTQWIIERLYETADEISQELLQIYPSGLRFPFEPNKEICCPINLTNNTDNEVHFSIIPSNPDRYAGAERLKGVVSPHSTHAVCVIMVKQQNPPPNMDPFRILMLTNTSHGEESLTAFLCDPSHASQITNKQEAIHSDLVFGRVKSMDVHPTKPWVVTGHSNGYVCIWKMKAQQKNTNLSRNEQTSDFEKLFVKNQDSTQFMSVKFIPRTQCIVSGDSFGLIHLYTYIDNQLVEVTAIEAHRSLVTSLAVHPNHHFLSSSSDSEFKLWEWNDNKGWVCSLEGQKGGCQMTFNPKGADTFAIVLDPDESPSTKSLAICSTNPDNPEIDFPSKSVSRSTCVAYCFPGREAQYMAIGHEDGHTEILDEQSKRHLHALRAANSGCVVAVACHLTLPLLVTGTSDGNVYLWNCTTYRLIQALSFGHGKVICFGFIDVEAFKRLVIGFSNIIKVVEIDWPTLIRQQ